MSFERNVTRLIDRGQKPDALTDIVQLIDSLKCVTVAYLDHGISDLQDKAIRNFLEKLEGIHYIDIMTYKIPGDRKVQLFRRKGAEFDLAAVIKRHKATRKKRTVYKKLADTVMIYDIPFQVVFINNIQLELINEEYDLKLSFYGSMENAIEFAKKTLNKMRFRKRYTKLAQYMKNSLTKYTNSQYLEMKEK